MAFRQFQRLGTLVFGRSPIVNHGCTALKFGGPCSRTTTSQSVIFQRVLALHTRTLSSCVPYQRTDKNTILSNHKQYSTTFLCESYGLNPAFGSLDVRHFSIQSEKDIHDVELNHDDDKPKKKSVFQRFKDAYKQYGKVLIGVHLATSAVWLGSFYYAAYSGIDIVPLLEKLGFGEKVTSALGKPGVGHIAVAYLLYKLATPARYTVTIVGTQMTVKQLMKLGYLQPIKKEDSLRSLFKEGRSQVKERYGDMKEEVHAKMVMRREKFTREFHTQRERFRTRHTKLRRDIERRAKLRNRSHFKNGKNGHSNGRNGHSSRP